MQGSLADDFYFVSVFSTLQELTFLCFFFFLQTKQPFNTISDLEATDQSPLSVCLVASGR